MTVRLWDIIVGIFMIFASLICQFIVIGIFVTLLCAGVFSYFGITNERWIWVVDIVVGVLLNLLTFYEFRRLRKAHRMLGRGGGFFLLPRGLYRIAYGRETFLVMPDTIARSERTN